MRSAVRGASPPLLSLLLGGFLILFPPLGGAEAAAAQELPEPVVVPTPVPGAAGLVPGGGEAREPERVGPGQVTPRGAFLRAMAVPGWGHAAVGAHFRGGVYVAAQSSTIWMLAKTGTMLRAARDGRELREESVALRLAGEGVAADSIPLLVAADPGVQAAQGLEASRRQQREDWVALGLFLVLLSGVDAFVSAHLSDFPEPLSVEGTLGPDGAALEFRISVPLGGVGRR